MLKKIGSAVSFLNKHGPSAFGLRVLQELGYEQIDRHKIDEVGIVVKALDIQHRTGVMIDVGAHYGHTSLPFCKAHWQVYSFEPDALNREKLISAIGAYSNAVIDTRALSNEEKESVIFYRSAQSTGISGLSAFHTSHTASDTVVVTTLRKSVEQYKIDSIDFLKIDTEGFDKFVLEGIPWETHAPITLVAEFEDAKTRPLGYDFVDFATYIASKGYQLMVSEWEPIVAYGTQHSWSDFKPYPCKLNTPQAWGNFIASLDTAVFSRITDECQRIKHKLN